MELKTKQNNKFHDYLNYFLFKGTFIRGPFSNKSRTLLECACVFI